MITLKRPAKEFESEAAAFKNEFFENGETTINGSELLDQMKSYDEWLKSVTDNSLNRYMTERHNFVNLFFS